MGVQVFREITVDFSNSRYIIINAKQHDSKSRFVRMTCTNVGQKVNLNPTDYSAFIRYRKSDGYGVFNKCIISTEGQIIFELTEQMLSTVGTSYADLVVIDVAKSDINDDLTIISADGRIIENNGSLASNMTFYINVLEKPINDWDIESTNEFSALNDLLLKASKDYEYIVQTTKEYMDNAKNSENKAYNKAMVAFNSALLSKSYAIGESGFLTNESWEKIITNSENYIPIESRLNENIENAKYYYEQSKSQADKSKLSADNAKISECAAKSFVDNIKESVILTRSYVIGDTNTREGEITDCAKYYYEQSKQISEGLNSALLYGVKGNAETDFRKGFVNITPENIGTYSKTEIDTIIQTLQNTIIELTTRVKILEDIIKLGDTTVITKIIDNDGNAITTDMGDILIMSQEKY